MKFGYFRAVVYGVTVFAAALLLTFIPVLPGNKPAEILFEQAASPSWKLRYDTLKSGELPLHVLRRGGMSDSAAILAIRASSASLNPRRIPAGLPITIKSESADSAPSEVTFQLGVDRVLRIKRDGVMWAAAEEKLKWTTDTIVVSGTIQSNLYAAVDAAAGDFLPHYVRNQLTEKLEDVYTYKVDMTRELQKGDEFKVLAERSTLETGGAMRVDRVLAASFSLSGSTINAVRFNSAKVGGDFFDESGKSLREAFRRAPIAFPRITSVFGSRRHPVYGNIRNHKGTDYGAKSGTPIMAIGDGTVIRAGWGGGYGNMIEIRHPNGFVTRYGHMRNFAKGIRAGSRVTLGETIGFVGSTGLSTGPHLHFEVIVNGQQRDSRKAFGSKATGDPIPSGERDQFQSLRDQLLPKLDVVPKNSATTLSAALSVR